MVVRVALAIPTPPISNAATPNPTNFFFISLLLLLSLIKGVEKYLEKSDFRYPRLTIQPFFRLSFTPRA
jgi:hypothetical protein